ncbi:unnamed protein product [Coffea canephora]|uniref:Serine/threonine-protein kinase BSK1-like TPR repeats domain-containing protein n=1 Tax=Coffea canephora TaxID=49390 RepID=A0A068U5G7_COFCA|nr:unnamed protein product [Coffea canephora]
MFSAEAEQRNRAFLRAAFDGNLTLLKTFGKSHAGFKDPNGRTALHLAAAAGKTEICGYLIDQLKLDMDERDDDLGDTPLILAIVENHNSTAAFLIEHGAEIMKSNYKAFTPLHYAAEEGNKEILQLLISKGAEIDSNSESGTPLQCAALSGKGEAVKILLDNKANPNSVTQLYFPPLMLSIIARSFNCLDLLLKAGADPNLGSCGKTPLIAAACEGETEIINCLLKSGADPNARDNCGVTPLEHAAMRGEHAAVKVLFPITSRISSFPDWSFTGIMKHICSAKAGKQRDCRRREVFQMSKSKGEDAFKRKDYLDAIHWYTEANLADPADATIYSNRSLCWALLNQGSHALSDAEMCVKLRPMWAKAHYREGAAWLLLNDYPNASQSFSEALKFDPANKEIQKAHREAVEAEFGIPVSENMRILRI